MKIKTKDFEVGIKVFIYTIVISTVVTIVRSLICLQK